MPATNTQGRLSLFVKPHSALPEDPYYYGSIKLKGDFRVDHDLHGGEALHVQISDADGNIISTATMRLATPTFKDVRSDGHLIGVERIHTAEIVD